MLNTWLDPQRMRYGSGYGALRSLAVLALRLTEPTPLVSSSSVGTLAWVGALPTSSTSGGGRLHHQVVAMGVA
jgi:hypothetical protein